MNHAPMLSADQLRHLLRRMATAPFGTWSAADIARVDSGEGWVPEHSSDGTASTTIVVRTPTPLLGAQWEPDHLSRDRFQSLEVTVGRDVETALYPQVAAVVSEQLGFTPQMRGGFGDGAAYHCWHPSHSDPRAGVTHFLVFDAGHVSLRLSPTDVYEYGWGQSIEYSVLNSSPLFPTWTAFVPGARLDGMFLPGGCYATDWRDLRLSVAYLVHSLWRSLPVLGDGATVVLLDGNREILLQFWIDTDGDVFVTANAEHPDTPTAARMAEIGYTGRMPGDHADPLFMVRPEGRADCTAAADIVVATLREMRASVLFTEFGAGSPSTTYHGLYRSDDVDGAELRLWGTGFRELR